MVSRPLCENYGIAVFFIWLIFKFIFDVSFDMEIKLLHYGGTCGKVN